MGNKDPANPVPVAYPAPPGPLPPLEPCPGPGFPAPAAPPPPPIVLLVGELEALPPGFALPPPSLDAGPLPSKQ